jgi:hypothetical protein
MPMWSVVGLEAALLTLAGLMLFEGRLTLDWLARAKSTEISSVGLFPSKKLGVAGLQFGCGKF